VAAHAACGWAKKGEVSQATGRWWCRPIVEWFEGAPADGTGIYMGRWRFVGAGAVDVVLMAVAIWTASVEAVGDGADMRTGCEERRRVLTAGTGKWTIGRIS
jgi:hypothetical protein